MMKKMSKKMRSAIMQKYLETFASQGPTAMKAGFKGVNDLALVVAEYELTSALGNTETLTLALPAGLDLAVGGAAGQGKVGWVFIHLACWSNADF